jgi:Asp-tRNA(Asn)/Glu-tRNA(Gln) amidotransferase A subunit family amidase
MSANGTVEVARGVRYRRLTVPEVLQRTRARYDARAARHNAEVTAASEALPTKRAQVLEEFPCLTRRWARGSR